MPETIKNISFIKDKKYKVEPTSEKNIFKVKLNEKSGLINKKGIFILEPIYDAIAVSDSKAVALIHKKEYLKNYKTKNFKPFYRGVYFLVDLKTEEIVTKLEDENILNISYFNSGLVKVNYHTGIDEEVFYMNVKGEKLQLYLSEDSSVTNCYNTPGIFGSGLVSIDFNNNLDLYNNKGRAIDSTINFIEIYTYNYNNPAITLEYGEKKYSVFGLNGRIIEPTYDDILSFSNIGYSIVKKNRLYGLIDNKGKVILEPTFKELVNTSNELIVSKKSGKYGVLNLKGELIIPYKYDDFKLSESTVKNGVFMKKNGNWVLLNEKNEIIFDTKVHKEKVYAVFYSNGYWYYYLGDNTNYIDSDTFEIIEDFIDVIEIV